MMAFISIIIADVGSETVALVVGIYAITIILTMAVIGSGIGMVFTRMRERGTRIHASAQILAAALVFCYGCYFLWQAVPSIAGYA